MAYAVRFDRAAVKGLAVLQTADRTRIVAAIEKLAEDPFAPGLDVKRLRGRDDYRLRVGAFRVLYLIVRRELVIVIVDIADRKEAYR